MKIKSIVIASIILLTAAAAVWSAQKKMITYTWDRDIQVAALPSGGGGFGGPGFPPVVNDPSNPAITVDPATGVISLGNSIQRGSGAVWYGGTTTGCNPCISGVCTFGIGFRAYFEFRFTTTDSSASSTTYGDGFNFVIANASSNDVTKRGGSPNSSVDMGELIGYAGSGNTSPTSSEPRATPPLDGLGMEPPKMSIEFDTYPNTGAMTYNGCSGGRQDNGSNNHLALMFWGANPGSGTMCNAASTAGNTFPQASFDDNIHRAGEGTTSNPYNSAASGNGSGLDGYYERARDTYNWLEDGQWHRARIEVIRTPSSPTYQVKAWIDCESYNAPYTACSAGELVYFQNVLNPYDNNSYLPKIDRIQQLDGTLNTMFNNIIFGFTVATGGATQSILINNFAIHFPTISISPTSRSHTYSSASGQTISVTAAAGSCSWTAVSNDDWITITGGASGTGSGTVTYSITANSGPARTGTITISGQTFTVTQAASPPTCTLVAGTDVVPYGSTNTLTWSVSGAATSATWTTSPGGTCGSPNPAGGSCTTAAQTTAGTRTFTLNVNNANGSSSCSTTFYVGCQNYQVWNGLGGRRDFFLNGGCRPNINNNSEITQVSNRLYPGETIQAYSTAGANCSTALGIVLNYIDAMNVDIAINEGDADCQVNFTGNNAATDR